MNYLQFEKNRSQLTIKSYAEDLRSFEAYFKKMNDQLSWESVDSDVIRDWMESMMDKGNNATSVNRRLSALRSLFRFAIARKRIEVDPTRMVKGPKRGRPLPQFLKEAEVGRLVDGEWGNTYKDVRARILVLTFYSTGM